MNETKDQRDALPDYLQDLLEATSHGIEMLTAAWEGLCVERQIQIIHAIEHSRFHVERCGLYLLTHTPNEYVRYHVALLTMSGIGISENIHREIIQTIKNDNSPVIRQLYSAEKPTDVFTNPQQFFQLPQQERLNIARKYISNKDFAELFRYAAETLIPNGALHEQELEEILQEYLTVLSKLSPLDRAILSHPFPPGILSLWDIVSILPRRCSLIAIRLLPLLHEFRLYLDKDVKNIDSMSGYTVSDALFQETRQRVLQEYIENSKHFYEQVMGKFDTEQLKVLLSKDDPDHVLRSYREKLLKEAIENGQVADNDLLYYAVSSEIYITEEQFKSILEITNKPLKACIISGMVKNPKTNSVGIEVIKDELWHIECDTKTQYEHKQGPANAEEAVNKRIQKIISTCKENPYQRSEVQELQVYRLAKDLFNSNISAETLAQLPEDIRCIAGKIQGNSVWDIYRELRRYSTFIAKYYPTILPDIPEIDSVAPHFQMWRKLDYAVVKINEADNCIKKLSRWRYNHASQVKMIIALAILSYIVIFMGILRLRGK
jgi:hypothetical protein